MNEGKLILKWHPRMNRFDVTRLVWRLLADHRCDLKMSSLRHRYPDTNHSTNFICRPGANIISVHEVLIERLLVIGWKRTACATIMAWTGGDAEPNTRRRCCLLTLGMHDVTPHFYVRTPVELMAMTL